MRPAARASTLLFAGLAATMVAIKLLFDLYPGDFPVREQAAAFGWPLVGGMIVLGLAGLFADRAARLPDPLSDARRERRGAVWAVLAGAAYGVITIGLALYRPGENPLTQSGEWDHVAWPWSVPFYTFGAIFLEFLLRLGALCVLFWLVHRLILRGRLRVLVFWSLAAVISAYEIWPYLAPDLAARRWDRLALSVIEPLYLSNLFEAWLLWRFGWLSPIVFRLSFYLVWHVLYGGLAQPG